MGEPNDLLRGARERIESPHASGDHLSREELADLVNTWLFERTGSRRAELDGNYIGKLEQGRIRWPQDPNRRVALRAVLSAKTDADLGLRRPRRGRTMVRGVDRQHFLRVWLTEKTADGTTRLGALAEFAGERVRKSQNLEKAYLHGRFGALPDVDRTVFPHDNSSSTMGDLLTAISAMEP
ncbi:MAG: hypothetical protein ACRDTG_31705 [Pseudonocardiaceae bacterium]